MLARLHGILAASTKQAMEFCLMELYDSDLYTILTDEENFIFAIPRGEVTPVMLMAHLDTCRVSDNVVLQKHGDTWFNANALECGCLGADDRAGVHIVLEIAKAMPHKPYILFTTGEEKGHAGAKMFCTYAHPDCDFLPESVYKGKRIWEPYVEDIYAIIQYDKGGFNKASFYQESAKADDLWMKVMSLGYEKYITGDSDLTDVQQTLGVAGVNLSCGFMFQHTPEELLLLPAIEFAIINGCRLLSIIDRRIPLPENNKRTRTFNFPPIVAFPAAKQDEAASQCEICGKHRSTKYITHADMYVCQRCINRIGGEQYVVHQALDHYRNMLEWHREKSKLANRPDTHPCPLCFETYDLASMRDGLTFCNKCQAFFFPAKDRVYFWQDGEQQHAYYRMYDNAVNIFHMTSPVPGIPIEWCAFCGCVIPKEVSTNYQGYVICHDCNAIDPR